jgi:hypothetical protein
MSLGRYILVYGCVSLALVVPAALLITVLEMAGVSPTAIGAGVIASSVASGLVGGIR